MHVVIRRYTGAAALADAMQRRQQEVRDLIRGVPGFVAYYAIQDGDGIATITVCQGAEGTTESTRRAADWVRQNLGGSPVGAPQVTEGDTFLAF